jgi:hypothetical protein
MDGDPPQPGDLGDAPLADQQLETLRVSYERVCHERDRLRDARAYFSRPLGPAPASAGISTALVTALGSNLDPAFVALALASLVALVGIGIWYDGKSPYRQLYAKRVTREAGNPVDAVARKEPIDPDTVLLPALWYARMIERDSALIGESTGKNVRRWPWDPVDSLQDGLDSERTGLRLVQGLWSLVILFLVLAVIA